MAGASKMYLAQYVMGAALARQQQYPQAIEYLRAAIELQPDSAWAHYRDGILPAEKRRLQDCGHSSGDCVEPVTRLCAKPIPFWRRLTIIWAERSDAGAKRSKCELRRQLDATDLGLRRAAHFATRVTGLHRQDIAIMSIILLD